MANSIFSFSRFAHYSRPSSEFNPVHFPFITPDVLLRDAVLCSDGTIFLGDTFRNHPLCRPNDQAPAAVWDKALFDADLKRDCQLFFRTLRYVETQAAFFDRTCVRFDTYLDRDQERRCHYVTLADIRFVKLTQNGRPTLACHAADLGKALELHGANTDPLRVQTAVRDLIDPFRASKAFLFKWNQERLNRRWDNDYTTDGHDWGYWDCNCVYAAPSAGSDYITIEGAMRLARQYRCDALWVKLNNAYLDYYYPPKQWEREAKAANDAAEAFLQQDSSTATATVNAAATSATATQEQPLSLPGEAYLPIADMTHEELELFMDVSIGMICKEDGELYFVYDEEEWAALFRVRRRRVGPLY